MIRNTGTAEYQFAEPGTQAAGRAICPFCNAWHSRSTGAPIGAEACDARYVRVRRVAIFTRGKPLSLGSGVRVPTASEKSAAMTHAHNVVNS